MTHPIDIAADAEAFGDVTSIDYANEMMRCEHDWKPVRNNQDYCPLCGYLTGEDN